MVGWIPRDPALRKEIVSDFLIRVEKCQEFGSDDVPIILQYDDRTGNLRPWAWPSVNGIPVRPNDLDKHRHTHYFKGPTCPCSFKNGPSSFTEAKIGLAQTVMQPANAQCLGQYVAVCALQHCGYLVRLERYFGHPKLVTIEYREREKPVATLNPFTFLTDDTEETIKRTGLRQIRVLREDANTGLRGSNRLLKREDPEHYLELQDMLKQLLVKGLPADKFWDLFIQCTDCRFVMPRQYFPYYHHCVVQVVHRQLGLPKIPPSKMVEEMIDVLVKLADAEEEAIEGEVPETAGPDGLPAVLTPHSKLMSLPWVDPNADLVPREPRQS
ncbi:hypothetical protein NMY22_g11501 [Coprinellus aureogranulatus]|nr:hypothetical protein NMY22_g11501 [Coprinellus aureogranulatus]